MISYYKVDVQTAQDYYPFGMLMPGRSGYQTRGGWAQGNQTVNGTSLPELLTLESRENDMPPEYKATREVVFTGEYVTGTGDEFLAYIADATNTGTGSGEGNGQGIVQGYPYGFGGQRISDEIKGYGNSYNAEFWEYDPRIGRRWNIDPISEAGLSPYVVFNNNPVLLNDPNGDKPGKPKTTGSQEGEKQTTKETSYGLHQIAYTETQVWFWHAGSTEYKTQAGWYSSEDYVNVLTPIGKDLAGYEGKYSQAAKGNWTDAQKADVANTALARFVGTGLSSDAARHLLASSQNAANKKNFSVTGTTTPTDFNVEDMLAVGIVIKQLTKIGIGAVTRQAFYSVQSVDDIARLKGGGGVWPSTPKRAHLGEGVYTWSTKEEAETYLKVITSRNSDLRLQVVKLSIDKKDLKTLKSYVVPKHDDAANYWLKKHSSLYGDGLPHGFQYIQRSAGMGTEHYFHKGVFNLFKIE